MKCVMRASVISVANVLPRMVKIGQERGAAGKLLSQLRALLLDPAQMPLRVSVLGGSMNMASR